ncbi:ubiquitin ligase E3A isoform 1 [Capsaspora owczarzaki ATCC 30864]|uniref:HECT-type E3 ubiquitin transferase n=1 Tax=Capsaspora owczarzaki (strain ATCC 30864) TaxID=595528 RepID=A0A0D2WUD4_CAPO3|nr:ubiquitin ligase E3A isoform 1 [Capsaspora owczarzaki ATCC 30864]KJE95518.1 ubiquitin ligase E3A isoform 1 [Capsaspora owczarzaki ATCC 30864]|eukprot:XP_004345557.2 ubiquitin ligase E3A isoform 1 [Capsaspora owczarzaki ATCC 30864]
MADASPSAAAAAASPSRSSAQSPSQTSKQQQQQQQLEARRQHQFAQDRPTATVGSASSNYEWATDTAVPRPSDSWTTAEKTKSIERLVPMYFQQLMTGCGQTPCSNPNCAGFPDRARLDPNASAALAINLASTHGEYALCPRFGLPKVTNFNAADLTNEFQRAVQDNSFSKFLSVVWTHFSDPELLGGSFLKSPIPILPACPVDCDGLRRAYSTTFETPRENVHNTFTNSISQMLDNTKLLIERVGAQIKPHHLNALVVILEHPILSEVSSYAVILPRLCECVALLPGYLQRLLTTWVSELPLNSIRTLLHNVGMFLGVRESAPSFEDYHVQNATKMIGLIYDANARRAEVLKLPSLPIQQFYNDHISEGLELRGNLINWQRGTGFTFCHFPFVITATAKYNLLAEESYMIQSKRHTDAFFNSIFSEAQDPYLRVLVRRDHIIEDVLLQLSHKDPSQLKHRLRVRFVDEEGVDEGGVQKEFFQLIFRDILAPKFGMFEYEEETRNMWFRKAIDDTLQGEYVLVGLLIGLAIYNRVMLDLHFPLVIYKKLLGKPVTFADLQVAQPALAHGLQELLEYDGDVEATFCRTFQLSYDVFGATKTHDLKPNGDSIPVTNENRHEFVQLYTDWLLNTSIAASFNEFKRGFDMVTADTAITLFSPEELEILICGEPNFDFHSLENATEYDGGFDKDSPVIRFFWEVVHDMSEEEKKRLLFFATGSDRVPVGGLSHLNLTIVRNGTDAERLPTAHTCFNVLMLSEYPTKEKLKERLLTAIENSEGFGLM